MTGLEGRTGLYRLGQGSLTAIQYQYKILGLIVRPYAVGNLLPYETFSLLCKVTSDALSHKY